jgi:hypothetical protein
VCVRGKVLQSFFFGDTHNLSLGRTVSTNDQMKTPLLLFWGYTFFFASSFSSSSSPLGSSLRADQNVDYSLEVDCVDPQKTAGGYSREMVDTMRDNGCLTATCKRVVVDGIFSNEEVDSLLRIAKNGMDTRDNLGGPTILDINSGHIRDTAGLDNLFDENNNFTFSADDFSSYGSIIRKLKSNVETTFGIQNMYFTAPTFITRLDGRNSWSPREIHDEYWHPHVDRDNTRHYHYSGLLYLSTYGKDFLGGKLNFLSSGEAETKSHIVELEVEPKAGRVIMFTSGGENFHHVERVTSGQRFVLAFWFTCDPRREMEIFLDGNAHLEYSRKVQDALKTRAAKAKVSQDL